MIWYSIDSEATLDSRLGHFFTSNAFSHMARFNNVSKTRCDSLDSCNMVLIWTPFKVLCRHFSSATDNSYYKWFFEKVNGGARVDLFWASPDSRVLISRRQWREHIRDMDSPYLPATSGRIHSVSTDSPLRKSSAVEFIILRFFRKVNGP
jgi:hypothetical protein